MNATETERVHVEGARTSPQNRDEDTAATQILPLDQVPVMRVAIDSLVIADSPRLAGENTEHIQILANAEGKLPPITVHRRGMRVLDGIHRLRAAQVRGHHEIEVQFFDGNDADAFVIAVKSNIAHGLPLSLADRKAAATQIIASHPQWSDRRIASVTGLAARTIAKARRKSEGQTSSADSRIGQDGRSRPTNSAERRTIASELLTDDPTLSLRHVAKIAGLSPETVRDVRGQLHDHSSTPPHQGQQQRPDHPTHHTKPQRHVTRPGGIQQVVRQLSSDPTLRSTETGRMLLRLLHIHGISSEKWRELSDNIPAQHKSTIADLAIKCAETWKKFSDMLTKQDTCHSI